MKKNLFILLALLLMSVNENTQAQTRQESCGFEQVQKELESENPELKLRREKLEEKVRLKIASTSFLQKIAQSSQNGQYTGKIYEISVVIHVIENRTGTGSTGVANRKQLTDEQIKNWIENANKMYAATYQSTSNSQNSFFPAGDGIDESAVIPFKLVLAKRDQNCQATTGIIRYNCTISNYAQYGMKRKGSKGLSESQMKKLAPLWNVNNYYNIYVITGFDGNFSKTGLLGYAQFPSSINYYSVMKAPVVLQEDNTVLAHEFGHALGLEHTFRGANSHGGECTATTGDCTKDDDKVCDTERCQSAYNMNPVPTNQQTNPCTNKNYQGVQYNVMNYGRRRVKFTPGQRARALAVFMESRASLTTSLAATPVGENTQVTVATCDFTGIKNPDNYNIGPTKVVLGTINNKSEGYVTWTPEYYVDYTTQACLNSSLSTEIPFETESKLKVSIVDNDQYIKAWIDYNDNGQFENTEIVANESNAQKNQEHIFSFTPPTTAVTGKFLRMRVVADFSQPNPCGELEFGQAEDYLVKIKKNTGIEIHKNQAEFIYYDSKNNQLLLLDNSIFGEYKIYNMLGREIYHGNSNSDVISLDKSFVKGVYILKFQQKEKTVSFKFLK